VLGVRRWLGALAFPPAPIKQLRAPGWSSGGGLFGGAPPPCEQAVSQSFTSCIAIVLTGFSSSSLVRETIDSRAESWGGRVSHFGDGTEARATFSSQPLLGSFGSAISGCPLRITI
jgi:hypothetical protein